LSYDIENIGGKYYFNIADIENIYFLWVDTEDMESFVIRQSYIETMLELRLYDDVISLNGLNSTYLNPLTETPHF
jgi:hypothetical protein